MNVFRGLISIPRISCVSQIYSARQLSSTLPLSTKRTYDKFYKITKQLQPIDKNVYEIGQERPDNISILKIYLNFQNMNMSLVFQKTKPWIIWWVTT